MLFPFHSQKQESKVEHVALALCLPTPILSNSLFFTFSMALLVKATEDEWVLLSYYHFA